MESNDKGENLTAAAAAVECNNETVDEHKETEGPRRTVENSIKSQQQHSIIQTDETITVIVDETFEVNGEVSPAISTGGDASSATESVVGEKKPRKKSVKFESDENIKKFIVGEEIVDQQNPFKDDEVDTKRFIIKKKSKSSPSTDGSNKSSKVKTITVTSTNSNGSAIKHAANPANREESSDFVTKEEVLRQSKYVPVYIKNPDSILTYDRSVLEEIAKRDKIKQVKSKQLQLQQNRGPIPMPRKSLMGNGKKADEKKKTSTTNDKKSSTMTTTTNSRISRKLSNYPDLADLKVSALCCFFFLSLSRHK